MTDVIKSNPTVFKNNAGYFELQRQEAPAVLDKEEDIQDFFASLSATFIAQEFCDTLNHSLSQKDMTAEEGDQVAKIFNDQGAEAAVQEVARIHPELFESVELTADDSLSD
jgi:hypothetical protein